MGIKNLVKKAGIKAANTVNRLSALSPDQIEHIEEQRQKYLSQMPDPSDPAAEELTKILLAVSSVEIFNAYLPQLKELYVPVQKETEYNGESLDIAHNIRYFNITKWVTDKKENSLEKLVSVYQVLSDEECNIALVFNRTCLGTNVFLAVVNTENSDNNVDVENYRKRLSDAIKGNCPGVELENGEPGKTLPCFENMENMSVAAASNIPTEKSEKFLSQTIEKLLDGVVPDRKSKEYTLVLLATPVNDVEERKLHLSNIYTALAPYASWQTNFQYTESDSTGSMAIFGVNAGVSAGVQNGINNSVSNTHGTTDSTGETVSESKSQGITDTIGENKTQESSNSSSKGLHGGIGIFGGNIGKSGSISNSIGVSKSNAVSKTVGKSISKITSRAVSNAKAVTEGIAKSTSLGFNFGANFARSSSTTATIGKNEGITQNHEEYTIKHALERLEEQMKRYEKGTALGMWDFAAYVVSEDHNVAGNVAHTYVSLTQGEESYMSRSAINVWRGDLGEDSGNAKEICAYLKELRHPLFGISPDIVEQDSSFYVYPDIVNAATALSGKELAYSLNFPKRSVTGLPVLECAEFGRNIVTYDGNDGRDDSIRLGHVFHMNHEEPTRISLSKNSLASHAFVTGSTGSGKSNTIYQILNEAAEDNVKFLVIEPAKGEYKNVFGMNDDVYVFGTNPRISPLLKIDPFSFPKNVHVFEHIDRLVEIFNVCWPMYAAMPAILKEAVERSYEDCGWDLTRSENEYDDDFYPAFADVARNIKDIIDSSEYDAENKGAYKGSLLTRLQSLTNGINGLIFTSDEIPAKRLFDENTIVDLSRVGSTETKSLLMGMLILKLQEHRMASGIGMNSDLRHITVLEEAHNILKRTSTDQTAEGANLLGKSVEMISNAIAEMRTYGEGFIISDQAPGLLDMAAIRNTNTKIIMRLPDQGDRELVGLSANLNEDQIKELAKLPRGAAAVYQNEWVQPVLCKIDRYDTGDIVYEYDGQMEKPDTGTVRDRIHIANILSNGIPVSGNRLEDEIKPILKKLDLDASIRVSAIRMMKNPSKQPRMTKLAPIYNALFPEMTDAVRKSYNETHEPRLWTENAERELENMTIDDASEIVKRDIIQCAMTHFLLNEAGKEEELERWSRFGGFA